MSVTFTEVAVGTKGSLLAAFRELGDRLLEISFSPRAAALFRYDPEEQTFADVASPSQAALQYVAPGAVLDESGGLVAVFASDAQQVTLRLGRQPDGNSIVFLELTDRTLYKFFAEQQTDRLHQLLTACAGGVGASVAFGAMELEWQPYTEQAAFDAVRSGPEGYAGNPPPFGLLRQRDFAEKTAREMGGMRFDLFSVNGYWLLQRKGLAENFAALRR